MACNVLQTLVKLLSCLVNIFDQATDTLGAPQHLIRKRQVCSACCQATSWCQGRALLSLTLIDRG